MKCDSILSSTVYPTWHPTRNWVVFSSNQTGQAFHIDDRQKVEVMDFGSDLVFFDGDKGTLTNILKTDDHLETFPCWAPTARNSTTPRLMCHNLRERTPRRDRTPSQASTTVCATT